MTALMIHLRFILALVALFKAIGALPASSSEVSTNEQARGADSVFFQLYKETAEDKAEAAPQARDPGHVVYFINYEETEEDKAEAASSTAPQARAPGRVVYFKNYAETEEDKAEAAGVVN